MVQTLQMAQIVVLLALFSAFILYHLAYKQRTIDRYSPMDLDSLEQKRFRIYLGGLEQPFRMRIRQSDPAYNELLSFHPKHPLFVGTHKFLKKHQNDETMYDLMQVYDRFMVDNSKLVKIAAYADSIHWFPVPTVAKTRHMGARTDTNRYCILLRLRSRIHFGPIQKDKIPFEEKKNVLIWRGGPSGRGFHNRYDAMYVKPSREEALKRWAHNTESKDHIDMGLTAKWRYEDFKRYLKPELSIPEMLRYKYVLSIEGNDVATNLKWALASNSVVFMTKPRVESWFAESLLQPYRHYIPVKDDFSDLLKQKLWADAHPAKCKSISQAANAFVRPFLNVERDYYLSFKVLQRYMELVDLTDSTDLTGSADGLGNGVSQKLVKPGQTSLAD